MAIDDRTLNLDLPKPNQDNTLLEDVARLREALDALDAAIMLRQTALGFTPENVANKGAVNGYAGLDATGKVPSVHLPSYVDDVLEFASTVAFPATGESGKIYVAANTNKTYRWSGSVYVEVAASPGTTDALTEGTTNLYFTSARARAAVPIATAGAVGLVKPGSGLNVAGDGTLNLAESSQAFTDIPLEITSNGQTSFTVAGGYTPGSIDVHLNGSKLNGGADDYTATNGTSITLTVGANLGDLLVLRRWATFDVANAVAKSGDTMSGHLSVPAGASGAQVPRAEETLLKTGGVMAGPISTAVRSLGALDINCALGNYFTKTIAANSTFTVSNVPSGVAYSFTLELVHTSGSITWFSGVQWPMNTPPTLITGKTNLFMFVTDDGGATWRGAALTGYTV